MDIRLKKRNNKSRYEFRHLAREVTREIYDIPEDNEALFAYHQSGTVGNMAVRNPGPPQCGWPPTEMGARANLKKWETGSRHNPACGVLSMSMANAGTTEPSALFDSDYYHHITFLFIKSENQRMGLGRQLVKRALTLMAEHAPERPVRVESALGAVGFFEKLRFVRIGDPYETFCAGSRLFQTIVNMEHVFFQTDPDSYPV